MDEHEPEDQELHEVERRLLAFGTAPLAPGISDRVLANVGGVGRRRLSGARLKLVSAAAIAGFAAGGVGLAAANVLPAPAQDVAHRALDAVGVHVPPGHVRYNDPTVCPGGPYANHGAYVRAHKDDPNAGESPCGKPVQSVDPAGKSKTGDTNDDKSETTEPGKSAKSNGQGPPPWAHGNGKPDDKASESDNPPTTKGGKPSSTTSPSTTATSTASTTSTSPSTSSTTSTTTEP